MPDSTNAPRRLIILGSTGSIGRSTLETVRHLESSGRARFEIVGLAAGGNAALLASQAAETGASHLAVLRPDPAVRLPKNAFTGDGAALELVERVARPGDLVMAAMVGSAGLAPTLRAIELGCTIALANKETLVAAGGIVTETARRNGVQLLPVDSEHSAIAQCLRGNDGTRGVRRIVLTASGGPFRTWSRERIESASKDEALRHPTWTMGEKITIDSASMMNKALEIIEAHWLFGLEPHRIDVIVHPQSIVHGFVEFDDGSVLGQLSPPDMKLPIQLALTWPERFDGCAARLDFASLRDLQFEPVDHERFPSVRLAARAVSAGGTAGAILNAANEVAVQAFLDGRIRFGRITALVAEALDSIPVAPLRTLAEAAAADAAARAFVASRMDRSATAEAAAWTR